MDDSTFGDYAGRIVSESQRRDERDSLLVIAEIAPEGGDPERARVRNVSAGGLMAQTAGDYQPGTRVSVTLEGLGRLDGSVAWAEAGRIGIAFDHPVEKTLARKPKAAASPDLFKPAPSDHRRPPVKTY